MHESIIRVFPPPYLHCPHYCNAKARGGSDTLEWVDILREGPFQRGTGRTGLDLILSIV